MENVKILLDGIEKNVSGLFYVYNSKYYFIYTEKEVDENDYVILYMTQVGKEIKNTENGPVDTGYMLGVEINNPEEQQTVQTSISYIVEDKKNGTTNPQIQYLPMSMLTNLKIVSKKRFRLLKSIMIDNFKLQFESPINNATVNPTLPVVENIASVMPQTPVVEPVQPLEQQTVVQDIPESLGSINDQTNTSIVDTNPDINPDVNVIIDYRTKYFEEEDKNKELQTQIDILTKKLEEIKKVIG